MINLISTKKMTKINLKMIWKWFINLKKREQKLINFIIVNSQLNQIMKSSEFFFQSLIYANSWLRIFSFWYQKTFKWTF